MILGALWRYRLCTYPYIPQLIGQLQIMHYKHHKRIRKLLPETVQEGNKITSDWLEKRDI